MFEIKNLKGSINLSGWSKSIRQAQDRFMNSKLAFCLIVTFLLTNLVIAATLNVPSSKYPTIKAAILQANDGDTIMISSGRYIGTGFVVDGINLTITSTFPTDPNRVVIDCNGEISGGFILYDGGIGSSCELTGLTIANARTFALNGLDGEDAGDPGGDGGWNIGSGINSYR